MGSIPDSSHVGLPLAQSPSDMAYSSGPSSVVSTRETSPASSTHHFPTATSPPSFRPNKASPSMDLYNNPFHLMSNQTAKVFSSNFHYNGGPLSSNQLCADDRISTNASPLPSIGDQSVQLSPGYFHPSAACSLSGMGSITSLAVDEAGANVSSYHIPKASSSSFYHKATSVASGIPPANEATANVLSPSTVNQQRVMVMPSNPGKPTSGTSNQHSASLAASLAANKATTTDGSSSTPMNHQAKDLPSKFRSTSYSPSGTSYPQPARLISDEATTSNIVSIMDDRAAKVSSGSFHEVNHSPSGVIGSTGIASLAGRASLAGTGHAQTIKSGHPLMPPPSHSQTHSSTPVPRGPSMNSWQSSTTSRSNLASPPSTTACSSTGGPSSSPHSNSHSRFATTTTTTNHATDIYNNSSSSSNALSSPVSPVQFGASNTFPRHYVAIANPSRVQTTTSSSAFRNDADQPSRPASAFLHDGDRPIQSTITTFRNDGDRPIQSTSALRRDVNRTIHPTSSFRRDVDQTSHHLPSTSSTSPAIIANMHPANGLIIAKGDMDKAMAYCYDRGDGTFTRLVPVDLLPVELENIPARVTSDEGMIVLPIPRKAGPNGQPANSQLTPQVMATPPSSPAGTVGTSTDLIQSRIDRIINSTPATSGPVVLARGAGAGPVVSKREKIYCDKWIHDGTCAFTQQGCKFKHEMPTDKETQMSLGLFHGLPPWWRRYCAERSMPLDDSPVHVPGPGAVPGPGGTGTGNNSGSPHSGASRYVVSSSLFSPTSGTGALNAASWRRRIEAPPAEGGPSSPSSLGGPVVGSVGRAGRGRGGHGRSVARYNHQPANFGPIGPPSKADAGSDTKRKAVAAAASSSTDDTVLRGRFAPRRGGGASLGLNQYDALQDLGEVDEKADDAGEDLD